MLLRHFMKTRGVWRTQRSQYAFSNLFNNFNAKKDYYSILGVGKKATTKEIKDSFYSLAKQYHPDHNKGFEDKFKEVNEANNVLGDE